MKNSIKTIDNSLEFAREILFATLGESFTIIPKRMITAIKLISSKESLKELIRQTVNCKSIEEYEEILSDIKQSNYIKDKDGLNYNSNYDLVVKWMSEEFRGKTLEVLGIKTAPIVDVFYQEQVDIPVKAGRLDVIFKDSTDKYYHLEEERNMTEKDMYRFAVYHFHVAYKLSQKANSLTDIIMTSGRPYTGEKILSTESGKYAPMIIDFTDRNGWNRLKEIKEAVNAGNMDDLVELVFIPLYGNEEKSQRSRLVEKVLNFELDLLEQNKLFEKLVMATIVISNKLLEQDKLLQIYERMKNMLDFLRIAKEEGEKEGEKKGEKKGRKEGVLEGVRDMVIETLNVRFPIISDEISNKIYTIRNRETLSSLLKQAILCPSLPEFKSKLGAVTE